MIDIVKFYVVLFTLIHQKKKKKIFDSKKRFWKIIESFSSGFISDFLSN